MNQSTQQIKQSRLRTNNGLFFIKSKHVNPNFKNHSYFQMKPKLKTESSIYNQSKQSLTPSQNEVSKRWKMFVDEPGSYGIENTFKYICNRIRQSKKNNGFLKKIQNKKKLSQNRQMSETPQKQRVTTLASQKNQYINNTHLLRNPLSSRLKQISRVKTQPANKYLMTTQSFNYRIKKQKPLNEQQKQTFRFQQLNKQCMAEHFVELVYINGRCFNIEQGIQNKITFNLLPYILNCFLKCKINYTKKFSQSEYNTILKYIQQIKSSNRSYFDVKDIINLSTVEQIFEMLSIYGHGSLQWTETIRYFFMPSQDVLNFQFKKLEDQIKIMSVLKFNAELNEEPIYIYRVEDKIRIQNIYDMLKPGTYIYSQNKAAYQIYCAIIKRRAQLYTYKNRIKKWRSVAPLDQTQSKSSQKKKTNISSIKATLSNQKQSKIQKYKRLYELTRQRHKKYYQRSNMIRDGISVSSKNYSAFIDKSKLSHIEDIFQ